VSETPQNPTVTEHEVLTTRTYELRCARCGQPIPSELSPEQIEELRSTSSVVFQHPPGQCPGEQSEAAGLRQFTITFTVSEVVGGEHEVLGGFTARGAANSAQEAVQPGSRLQVDFTNKVDQLIATIGFADRPAGLETKGAGA
jgi:hypothetical protein